MIAHNQRYAKIKIEEQVVTRKFKSVKIYYENGEVVTPEGDQRKLLLSALGMGEHSVLITDKQQITIL